MFMCSNFGNKNGYKMNFQVGKKGCVWEDHYDNRVSSTGSALSAAEAHK